MEGKTPITWESRNGVLEGDMLAAAYALNRFPLYDYANANHEMHLTFFCLAECPDRAFALIRIALWCGQMQNYSLHLHIVSDDAEKIRERLLKEVPVLAGYTNLDADNPGEYQFADFEFVTDPRVELASRPYKRRNRQAEKAGEELGTKYDGQWSAVLMGERSTVFAARYYLGLTQQPGSLLLLDGQTGELDGETAGNMKTMRTLHFLEDKTKAMEAFRDELLRQALWTHLVYTRNGHAYNNCEKEFLEDRDSQESSAAFALHIPYKLKDIGINPKVRHSVLSRKYAEKALPDKESDHYDEQLRTFCALAGMEHRRWLMYLVTSGWRAASINDCREFCFKANTVLKKPCYRFKIAERSLHPALVPGMGEKGLAGWTKAQWDEPRTEAQLNKLALDPLDMVSLRLHLLAGEIMQRSAPERQSHLEALRRLADGNSEALRAFSMFSSWYLSEGCSEHSRYAEDNWFGLIEEQYRKNGIDGSEVEKVLELLRTELKIVNEYYSYNDYKDSDNAVIEQMAYIYLKPKQLSMITMAAEGMLDNLAAPLMISPDRLTVFGMDEEKGGRLKKVLEKYTDIKMHRFEALPTWASPAQIYKNLKTVVDREMEKLDKEGLCVLDITGAPEAVIASAVRLREEKKYKKLGLLMCDSASQRVTDLGGFPYAAVCKPHVSITVKEMMELYQASACSYDTSELTRWNLLMMKDDFRRVWDFARKGMEYKNFYEVMNTNLATGFTLSSWGNQQMSFEIPKAQYEQSGLKKVLEKMQADGQAGEWKLVPEQDNYRIKIKVPDEAYFSVHLMLCYLREGGSDELVYQSNEEYCCISVRGEKRKTIAQWKAEDGDRTERKMEFTLDADRLSRFKLPALFSGMKAEKLIKECSVSGTKISIKGPAYVLNAIGTMINVLRLVQKANLVCDAEAGCIYHEEPTAFVGKESPMPEMVPAGCSYLSGWKRVRMDEAKMEWKLTIGLMRRTQLERVLADIAASTSQNTPFTWEKKESLIDSENVRLICRGPKRVIDALDGLIQRLQDKLTEDLVYNKQKHSIAPQHSTVFRAILSKKEQQTAIREAEEAGVICNLKFVDDREAVFDLPDRSFAEIFENDGKLFEFFTWYAAYKAGFDDVQNGYRFLWGAPDKEGNRITENELDVLAIKGLQLMLISCKATKIAVNSKDSDECKYNMYEIRMLANQFSKNTKAVLVYLTTDTLSKNLENRSESIGTKVLVLDRKTEEHRLTDGRTLTEALKEQMK
ncbi:MAG: hypothetical protein IJE08_06730 [Clostridia bacterium]|nr:hypothetical protein [Clostridia bacterium]